MSKAAETPKPPAPKPAKADAPKPEKKPEPKRKPVSHGHTFPPGFHAAIALLVVVASLVGCATTATPQRKAYTSIDDTVAAAKAAMQVFNERYQNGLQTEEDRTKVLAAWASFQSTIRFAETLAKDPNRTSDPVAVATDAVGQLLNLIATLKGKPTSGLWLPPIFYWPAGGFA